MLLLGYFRRWVEVRDQVDRHRRRPHFGLRLFGCRRGRLGDDDGPERCGAVEVGGGIGGRGG